MTNLSATPLTVDINHIKGRQQAAWNSGEYSVVGTALQIVGGTLCAAVDLRSQHRVLDVAAGNGNASLADIIRNLEQNVGDLMGYIMTDGPGG